MDIPVTSALGTGVLQHMLHPLGAFSLLGNWNEKFGLGPPHLVSAVPAVRGVTLTLEQKSEKL